MDSTYKINVETEGFDEAIEKIEMLADAYDGFPAQLVIKNCRGCTINVHPSQVMIKRGKNDE